MNDVYIRIEGGFLIVTEKKGNIVEFPYNSEPVQTNQNRVNPRWLKFGKQLPKGPKNDDY